MSHTTQRRVLVTGAAGVLGRATCPRLRSAGWFVRGFDLNDTRDVDEAVIGDLAAAGDLDAAVATMNAIIHLAACPRADADFYTELLEPNVVGVMRLFDAARKHEVPRIVLGSSGHVRTGLRREQFSDGVIPTRPGVVAPCNAYGLTKAWAETAGEMHARMNNVSVLSARIGWIPRDVSQATRQAVHPGGRGAYLSPDDCGRFFLAAITAEFDGFAVADAIGAGFADCNGSDTFWDRLGYTPQDLWPTGMPEPLLTAAKQAAAEQADR